ncbi:MAG: DNA double-strand break repair nuclease NurA [Candidatus Hydrothermarchaeaceae archaeon]
MLEATYEVLARKRNCLRQEVDGLLGLSKEAVSKGHWNSARFNEKRVSISAEDGSANHISYKGFILYAVNALAILYDGHVEEFSASDIGILEPYRIEERLALYRSIFEIKVALEALDHSKILLLDGSMSSDLGTPKYPGMDLNSKEKEEVLALLPEVEKKLTEEHLVAKGLSGEFKEKRTEKTLFLEYLEYLACLVRLLEGGMDKVVGVSKTSTRTSLIEGLPDVAVYERISGKSGYSELKKEPLASKFRRRFFAHDEFLNSIVFTSCYARLVDGKGVLFIEMPKEVDEGDVVDILEKMRAVSVDGYPYPLRKAHREVVITNRDMRVIKNSIGLTAKTGREVL